VTRGISTWWQRASNEAADKEADKGRELHPVEEAATKRVERATDVVRFVAKYLARCAVRLADAGWPDTTKRSEWNTAARMQGARNVREESTGGHQMRRQVDGRWRCTCCLRSGERLATIRSHPCLPGQRHRIFDADSVFFCGACGCYTHSKARGLLHECRGATSSAGRRVLDDLWQGKCPSTGVPIPRPMPLGAIWAGEDLDAACRELSENGATFDP
jgi:hypothetical protein